MTGIGRLKLIGCALAVGTVLASCQTDKGPAPAGIAPLAPAFLVDQPSENKNGIPVNYTQSRAGNFAAPDPLVLKKKKRISKPDQWTDKRRPDILRAFEDGQFGKTLNTSLITRHITVDRGTEVFDGLGVRKQVTIRLLNGTGSADIDVLTYLPATAIKPVPVLLNASFSPNVLSAPEDAGVKDIEVWTSERKKIPGREARSFGKFDIEAVLKRGYGVALVYYGQIEPDFEGGAPLGVRALFGAKDDATPRGPGEWGAIGAWAWGLSRVVDYLEEDPGIDKSRIALYGVSRLGKTALWAGAQDMRYAMIIASCSGEGGAALSRRNYGETIAHMTAPGGFAYQFAPRWKQFALAPEKSPLDSDLLISLIAPRPLLLITGESDAWSDPYGEFLAARAASPVWQLFGKTGIAGMSYPQLDQAALTDLAFYTHAGGHGTVPRDMEVVLDFMGDKFGAPKPKKRKLLPF